MATRSRTSFQKRQKELLRMEKQREKAARRAQRKLEPKETGDPDPDTDTWPTDEVGTLPDGTSPEDNAPDSALPEGALPDGTSSAHE